MSNIVSLSEYRNRRKDRKPQDRTVYRVESRIAHMIFGNGPVGAA